MLIKKEKKQVLKNKVNLPFSEIHKIVFIKFINQLAVISLLIMITMYCFIRSNLTGLYFCKKNSYANLPCGILSISLYFSFYFIIIVFLSLVKFYNYCKMATICYHFLNLVTYPWMKILKCPLILVHKINIFIRF